jgi:CHAT domain-containing protein
LTRYIFIFLMGINLLRAQSNLDSLLNNGAYQAVIDWVDATGENPDFESQASKISALISLGRFTEASALMDKIELVARSPYYRAIALNLRGFLEMQKGLNADAEIMFEEAFKLFTETGNRNSLIAARCLSNLGTVNFNSGKIRQAESNHQLSLQIRQKIYGENHPEVAAAYNDLGLVYSNEHPAKALEYFQLVLNIYTKVYGADHPKISILNTNIGIAYKQLGKTGDAVLYFENALDGWRKIYPQGHPNQALVLSYLGQTYATMKNQKEALGYFNQALNQYARAYGKKHPDIAALYNQFGLLYTNMGKYDSGLVYIQEALKRNSRNFTQQEIEFNPSIKDYYNPFVMLYSLQLKAETLELRHFGKTLRFSDLKLAIRSIAACDSIIDLIRHESNNESDKIALGSQSSEIYETGVRISQSISEMSTRPEYWSELAFYFAEKSKSGVLLESIADANARNFSGIPDELVKQEKELRAELSLQSRLLTEVRQENEENTIRTKIFDLNQAYQSFTISLEKNYPRYFNLKFKTTAPKVEEIKKRLNGTSAVVSYFIAEKNRKVYIFTITRQKLMVKVRSLPANFDRKIRGFYNSMVYDVPETFSKTGFEITKLLMPQVSRKIKKLTIIPIDRLCVMPFESLPYGDKINTDGYPVKYWLNRFDIGYEFAAALLTEQAKQKANPERNALLLAPINFSETSGLGALPGTEKEINNIKDFFPLKNEVLSGKSATETFLKNSQLSQYRYIHLATHGVVDEETPERSRIYLNETSQDDGKLFTGEIFGLSFSADLVTLSACETGLGKISKGEGVIGLSRALRYAGADKIVVSFWSVADESTAMLMQDFYRNIANDPNADISTALANAKRKMIEKSPFRNPFYWAPFALVGF